MQRNEALVTHPTRQLGMEILRFVWCEAFPEGVRMIGCICDDGDAGVPQGHAVICVVSPADAPPIARRMTAMEARLEQRYTRQQIEQPR
jgi:hypothetical protein